MAAVLLLYNARSVTSIYATRVRLVVAVNVYIAIHYILLNIISVTVRYNFALSSCTQLHPPSPISLLLVLAVLALYCLHNVKLVVVQVVVSAGCSAISL